MAKWIFQDIRDIKDNVLYANYNKGMSMKDATKLYNEELRKKVSPEIYVRYLINGFDIYLDIEMVRVCAQNVYPDLTANQIYSWINEHKSAHHILTT